MNTYQQAKRNRRKDKKMSQNEQIRRNTSGYSGLRKFIGSGLFTEYPAQHTAGFFLETVKIEIADITEKAVGMKFGNNVGKRKIFQVKTFKHACYLRYIKRVTEFFLEL